MSLEYVTIVPREASAKCKRLGCEVGYQFANIPEPSSLLISKEDIPVLREQLNRIRKERRVKVAMRRLASLSDELLLGAVFSFKEVLQF